MIKNLSRWVVGVTALGMATQSMGNGDVETHRLPGRGRRLRAGDRHRAFEDAEDYAGNILARIVAFGFLTYFLVNGLLLWRRSQTVGKALLGLVVVAAGADTRAPAWRLFLPAPFFMALYGVFSAGPG